MVLLAPVHELRVAEQTRVVVAHGKLATRDLHPLAVVALVRLEQPLVFVGRPVDVLVRVVVLELVALAALCGRARAHILGDLYVANERSQAIMNCEYGACAKVSFQEACMKT